MCIWKDPVTVDNNYREIRKQNREGILHVFRSLIWQSSIKYKIRPAFFGDNLSPNLLFECIHRGVKKNLIFGKLNRIEKTLKREKGARFKSGIEENNLLFTMYQNMNWLPIRNFQAKWLITFDGWRSKTYRVMAFTTTMSSIENRYSLTLVPERALGKTFFFIFEKRNTELNIFPVTPRSTQS